MADNFFKVRNGINLGTLSADPSNGVQGDTYCNTTSGKIREYVSGAWRDSVQADSSQTLSNKTLALLQLNVSSDAVVTGANATLSAFTTGIVRLTNGSLVSVSGIPAGGSGQTLIVENQTGVTIIINNNEATATAANRIYTGTGTNVSIPANATLTLAYDTTASRWMLIGSSGSGTTTITVTAGENLAIRDAVYISKGAADGSRTAGRAYKLDPTSDNRMDFIGICTAAITSAATGSVQLIGEVTGFTGLTEGQTVFGSVTTPGSFQITAPNTTGHWVVQLGIATSTTSLTINGAGSASAFQIASAGSSSGSGGTGKNYITNGTFESATTTGWSLGTATLTSNLPTGAPTFGSGASGNLSLTTVASGQLSGTNSLSLVSSAATTAGNFLATDAMAIDLSDQAKILNFSFNYKQFSGTAANFSGTTSNSFGVAIYDVTNSAWIIPAGVFNLVQGTGVGRCTGTFQTASNAASLRLVIYNANATPAACTMYFDDIVLGPQITVNAPAMDDPIAYTPTFTGFGTPTGVNFVSYRIGAYLYVEGKFTAGTSTATEGRISLGYAGGNSNVTIQSTIASPQLVGRANNNSTSTTDFSGITVLAEPSVSYMTFGREDSTENGITKRNGNSVVTTGGVCSLFAKFPIVGWSSNSVMSQDTDTRVVAARYYSTSAQSIANNTNTTITWNTKVVDTHAAMNTGTGVYTIPVAGLYRVTSAAIGPSTATGQSAVTIRKNGTGDAILGIPNATVQITPIITALIQCVPGDTIDMQFLQSSGSAYTFSNNPAYSYILIERLSGPAVVAASESVNASYSTTATTSLTTTPTTLAYATKEYDSHNAYNTGTGVYTIPVTGKYKITWGVLTATSSTVGLTTGCDFRKNSSTIRSARGSTVQASGNRSNGNASVTIPFNAGDTMDMQQSVTTGSTTFDGTAAYNFFQIERVGN